MRLGFCRSENDDNLIYIRRNNPLSLPAARRAPRQLRMSGQNLFNRPVRPAAVGLEHHTIPDSQFFAFVGFFLETTAQRRLVGLT